MLEPFSKVFGSLEMVPRASVVCLPRDLFQGMCSENKPRLETNILKSSLSGTVVLNLDHISESTDKVKNADNLGLLV